VLLGQEGSVASQPGAAVVLREFEFRDADIWFVRFALDPRLEILAVGNKFGKLWLWNVDGSGNGGAPLVKAAGHVKCTAAIRQTAFSPDRRFLLCCCEDGSIWKWAVDYTA
jgi:polycomb protein EED